MRTKLVAGNWKMHGSMAANPPLLQALKAGAAGIPDVSIAVCVPFPYLQQAGVLLDGSRIGLGAQNLSEHESGAYTGEVSAGMLQDFGCRYVIVGHSERRALYAESDAQVARKFVAAQRAGLIPILCVGETLAEREQNATESVVARQLDAVIEAAGIAAFGRAVIAYEPVWAIGTGRTATPEQAQAVHKFIRERVAAKDAAIAQALQLLYGGSVKPGNAKELFAKHDVDGGLIGGASLVAEDFLAICAAA
ncbi:MAG TPA: triose-phosphate isomerase [Burkholderiales bacterium]|nr:triose-phosphate isomerase [Burkholderiales bacterium]